MASASMGLQECPGCGYKGRDAGDVKSHLGNWLYARAANYEPATVLRLNSSKCRKFLKRDRQSTSERRREASSSQGHRGRSRSPRGRAGGAAESIAIASLRTSMVQVVPQCARDVPAELCNYSAIEQHGLGGSALVTCRNWVSQLPCIQSWFDYGYGGSRDATLTFFVHIAYSVITMGALQPLGLEISENTVCIGVGGDIQYIDDVAPFKALWQAGSIAGLTWDERVVYILWAHDLVRPYMIRAIANVLMLEQTQATKTYVVEVQKRLFRRHAVLKRPAGKDRLHLGSSQTRAHGYAGTVVVDKKLKRWDEVQQLAKDIVRVVGSGCTFSELTATIEAASLPGMQDDEGYWVNHLARLFTEEFAGVDLPGSITVDPAGMQTLSVMGEGASDGLALMGVGKSNVAEALPRLCRVVAALATRVGRTANPEFQIINPVPHPPSIVGLHRTPHQITLHLSPGPRNYFAPFARPPELFRTACLCLVQIALVSAKFLCLVQLVLFSSDLHCLVHLFFV